MKIHLASHYGMCFGVRDALRKTHEAATAHPVTVLGQLVHNPEVDRHLRTLGVTTSRIDAESAPTQGVVITAHGASDAARSRWSSAGYRVTDTTCPLVRRAHDALELLAASGYHPVIIGEPNHAEVRGLAGDYPEASIIRDEDDFATLPPHARFGVISQTTQPLVRVLQLVDMLKRRHPHSEVRFIDTVCRPTKQRQSALESLCATCDTIVVVGGRNSNNTRQLVERAGLLGAAAHHVETPADLRVGWFRRSENIGVTAGTSTLDETVQAVVDSLQRMAAGGDI